MLKQCVKCSVTFEVTDEDLKFLEKVSPVFDGKKFLIPSSGFCPLCRQQRRLSFRNERSLYSRKSDLSGKSIISIYAPDKPYKVYDQDEWWGDKWDPLQYSRDFDFNRSFSEQLRELYVDVPHVSLYNTNVENSYYTNYALNQKNSYLIFGGGDDEDCVYGKFVVSCKDCVDILSVYSCEFCYQGVACEKCYGCRFFMNSRNCSECSMIDDCLSCKNCLCCFGLRNKEYCILNKQYSREEYEKFFEDYKILNWEKIKFLQKKLDELKIQLPHVQSHIYGSENCSGDNVYNCKNCDFAFDAKNCEDCKYIYFSPKTVETQDCVFCAPDGVQFCYNVCSLVGLQNALAVFYVWYGSNIYYSMECHHCDDLFGCVGLKKKKYCIFNKQYSKAEYEKMVAKIIEHMQKTGEWGEYFPYNISPFSYNETIANEYFPLKEEEVTELGGTWRKEEHDMAKEGSYFVPGENISEVDDSICDKILKCEVTGRAYKILPAELKFYRRMGVPIPKVCPDQRHYERLKFHSNFNLWDRKCDNCGKNMKAIYPPESREKVFCEECYLKTIY